MLCPETHSKGGERLQFLSIFLQHSYLHHAVHVQNGPKMHIYQQTISNKQPVTYSLSQIVQLSSPVPTAPVGFIPLPWLGAAAGGSRLFERGKLGHCLPFVSYITAGTREMEEEAPVLVRAKQNT